MRGMTGPMRLMARLGGLWGVLWLMGSLLFAQTGTGVIRGVVRDSAGAVVPGAEVRITNQETNLSRDAITSERGIYYFGGVPRGRYTVEVELPGFKKWVTQLELQVGETAVVDAELQVGELQTTVEVRGAATAVNTESMEVADVKDFQRIQQLPLNGRAISSLFSLTPGVEGGGSARVNAMKVGSLEITLDGVSLVDRFGGGIARVQPGLDTVQEFRIETVGSDARYSRPATATLVTRSGTNEFHGSLFETHRNNGAKLRARRREESGEAAQLIRNGLESPPEDRSGWETFMTAGTAPSGFSPTRGCGSGRKTCGSAASPPIACGTGT